MKNRMQKKTNQTFNKHIKNELSCCIMGNPVSRNELLKYYQELIHPENHNGASDSANPSLGNKSNA